MKTKLEQFIREHPKQRLTEPQKFRMRYGEHWRDVVYCEMPYVQENVGLNGTKETFCELSKKVYKG